ncbi:MAG: crosslink repair DNA glycosylase YcaQ family protein [Thalassobaculum sp.]|uniref:winged helix-turn-helix domain-containing protein n=1 Tax=Thalassobaculum sp. TaxID=2022740 RepID=UPI0032ECFE35
MTDRVSNADLRRLFLERHALADPPGGPLTRDGLDALIERLGFVQVDTISTLEQAHHHILFTRANGYRKPQLKHLLEKRRSLFEHWTHDASVIPTRFYPYWKPRFQRRAARIAGSRHWIERFNGRQDAVLDEIRQRVRENGPVGSRDVTPDDDEERGAWWGWTPSKAALEYLWHTGEFAVTARRGFSKLYDLAERVIPDEHREPEPTHEDMVDWTCREAIARLGVASHSEVAGFFEAASPDEAKAWCAAAGPSVLRRIEIEHADGSVREVFARPDVLELVRAAPEPPARVRFLSPFDPMIRDRDRAQRFFGFDYRFEAFVPAARRVWGYYVLPMLERDRLIGRIELKAHRDRSELEVRGFWLEPRVRAAASRMARIDAEVERWRAFAGLDRVTWSARRDTG